MLKIGDFSKISGISIKTLRYYDEIDLFKPSYSDRFTGYRYYMEEQLVDIKIISELKKINLSLEMIKEYIKTKNIEILNKKKEEFIMKIDEITNFVNKKYKEYTIKEGGYDDYVLINGIKNSACPTALEIRDGNAKYYIVNDNDKFIDDFVIFINTDNWITIDIKKLLDDAYMNVIFGYLKEKNYDYVSNFIPIEMEKEISYIREKFKKIKEKTIIQGDYKYIKFTIYLYKD